MLVSRISPISGRHVMNLAITEDQIAEWREGLVVWPQDIFPQLSKVELEFLMTGYVRDDFTQLSAFWPQIRKEKGMVNSFARIPASKMFPIAEGLPEKCYAMHPTRQEIILLERGCCAYEVCRLYVNPNSVTVDLLNEKINVTPEQRQAMLMGSLFGWNTPAADPDFWRHVPGWGIRGLKK